MMNLKKGDCEHCGRLFRYSLWHSGFGDNSYAYCDDCGMLGTIGYSHEQVADFPQLSAKYMEIDQAWEPHLRPCLCGGRFRKGTSPRCPYCHQALSAMYSAAHMERQARGAPKGWRWQRNWSGTYCMAIEDPHEPGTLLQMLDPVIKPEAVKPKGRWSLLFSFSR
jgi:hypothetical protein